MINKDSKIAKFLIPSFNELTIFCMSYAVIVLLFINNEFRDSIFDYFIDSSRGIILLGVIVTGIIFSIYHIFSSRKKGIFEKMFMLLFVVIMNSVAGLYGFFYLVENQFNLPNNIPVVFPIWNFAYSIYLLALARGDVLDSDSVSDENVSLYLSLVSISLLSILIIFCNYYIQLYWVFTFSISLAYLSIFGNFVLKIQDIVKTYRQY